jgi:hypothetical protein
MLAAVLRHLHFGKYNQSKPEEPIYRRGGFWLLMFGFLKKIIKIGIKTPKSMMILNDILTNLSLIFFVITKFSANRITGMTAKTPVI